MTKVRLMLSPNDVDLGPRDEVRSCAVLFFVVHGEEGDGRAFVSCTK